MTERLKLIIELKYNGVNTKFAEAIGINKQQMQVYLSGKSKPGADTLEKIAAIGINVQWLLTGEGEMEIKPASEEIKTLRAENERLRQTVKAVVQSVSEFSGLRDKKENGEK